MLNKKPTLEQRIDAIIDRYNGVPYAQVLERRGLTPNQFYIAATHKLHDLVEYASEEKREVLEKILADDEKYRELFRMGEEFIREQYLRVIGKLQPKQRRLPEGIFVHPENLELLAYCALTYHNPKLASEKRAEVIQGVKELPAGLAAYLHSIGLTGLMNHALNSSPLEVLKAISTLNSERHRELMKGLWIGPNTLKTHRNNIYKKLHVSDMFAASYTALRAGIITLEGQAFGIDLAGRFMMLGSAQRSMLPAIADYASRNGCFDMEPFADELHFSLHTVKSYLQDVRSVFDIDIERYSVSTRARLAVVVYAYATLFAGSEQKLG